MLKKAEKEITTISKDEKINSENYLESLDYIENLYLFINKLKLIVPIIDVTFKPTFIGKFTSEKFNIPTNDAKSEMKLFSVVSSLFLEDKRKKQESIQEVFGSICALIEFDGEQINFTLK